ncbi:hypothetical protein D3869_10885 [Azospirillum brasilense]|uniref:Uncharacterized protein n=1 Tax=Azospirillum brasilense TaxID=192 RepID=A0A4D8R177_AZOBR|nr:hypothetical protein [Azospirillum brasilense]QCO15691.1 hypothetical protein D3869_10885 [Azospirillum brasilense]
MARQSMFAFFPLDEDVMVGDVFLNTRGAPTSRDDGNFDLVRIARTPKIEVARGLCDSQKERLFIAFAEPRGVATENQEAKAADSKKTVDAKKPTVLASPASSPCPMIMDTLEKGDTLPSSIRLADAMDSTSDFRLGHASIPKLTVARLTEAQIGASGLLGNFGANLGFASSSNVALTIELKDLQQLQLELPIAIDMLRRLVVADTAVRPGAVVRIMARRWPEGTKHLCRGDFAKIRDGMSVAIVTRVLYAGKVEYQFSRSAEMALRLAIHATSVLEGQPQAPTVPSLPTGKIETPTAAEGSEARVRAAVNALLASVTGGETGKAAGGHTTLAIGSLGGTSLSSQFPRPLAAGAGTNLVFTAESALLPQDSGDIKDVMEFCSDLLELSAGSNSWREPIADWCPAQHEQIGARDPREGLRQHMCKFLEVRSNARNQQNKAKEQQKQNAARGLRKTVPAPPLPGFVPTDRVLTGVAKLG